VVLPHRVHQPEQKLIATVPVRRRLLLVPFTVQIPPKERDSELPRKLVATAVRSASPCASTRCPHSRAQRRTGTRSRSRLDVLR
jgi:hypothetical protein